MRRITSGRLLRHVVFTLLLFSLTACISQRSEDTQVAIARGITLPLMLPTQTTSITQKITGQYRDNTHVMIMQVEASPQSIVMVGMAPTGTQLFNIHFDGKQLNSWQSPLFHAPFHAGYVLADYQIAALPAHSLQALLPEGVTVQEQDNGAERTRFIINTSGNTVIDVRYRASITQYCHRERDYCLLIETLE